MTALSVPSSRPFDDRKADVLRKVSRTLGDPEAQPMLVGAFARDVWFWHLNGIETGDLQRAGAVLLGRDMAAIAGKETRAEVVARLVAEIRSHSRCPLTQELMRQTKGDFLRARELMRDLLADPAEISPEDFLAK